MSHPRVHVGAVGCQLLLAELLPRSTTWPLWTRRSGVELHVPVFCQGDLEMSQMTGQASASMQDFLAGCRDALTKVG